MGKIRTISSATIKQINERIHEAVSETMRELGIDAQTKGMRYSNNVTGQLTLELAVIGENGESAEQVNFNQTAMMFGLKSSDYERRFRYAGQAYQLVGLKPRSPKYPIIGRDIYSGKTFKFPRRALENLT